ncbi:hypothetical protein ACLK19_18880 [Escherichia coli]
MICEYERNPRIGSSVLRSTELRAASAPAGCSPRQRRLTMAWRRND